MIQLRPYQNKIIEKTKEHLKSCRRVLINSPTGSGKTVIFSRIASGAAVKGNKVCIISHRIELLTQSGSTLEHFGLKPFLIKAGLKEPPEGEVFVAMSKTLKNRLVKPEWSKWWSEIGIIIIDEAHISSFNWLLEYEGDKTKIGVTATAKRAGKMPQLSSEYDALVNEVDVQELINLGFLVPDKYYGVPTDISGVRRDHNGEFHNAQLHEKFAQKKVFKGVADNIKRISPNEQSICFCVNIIHCVQTAINLNAEGITAKFITSKFPKPKKPYKEDKEKWDDYNYFNKHFKEFSGERDTIIQEWRDRKFDVLINAGIFIEGFDEPSLTTVIMNFATTSANKFLQVSGRGARIHPESGKRYFKLLDFGANADRLGHYRAEREFSLSHKEGRGGGVTPTKSCKKCESLCLVSAKKCKYCGHPFPSPQEAKEIELIEKKWDNPKELEAAINGRSKAWVWRQIYEESGREGLMRYAIKKKYSRYWVDRMVKVYSRNKNRRRTKV